MMEELVMTTDLKKLRRLFQKTILKSRDYLENSNARVFDEKNLLRKFLKEMFIKFYCKEIYQSHVLYSLSWLKLLQTKKKSSLYQKLPF
jgi:hypothetical protein